MSDDSRRVSRRTALKGIAAFAGAGAVGAGGIIHGTEPALATSHVMSIDDLTIETSNGEVTEFGIRDLWYEVTWENIVDNELTYGYYFDSPITANYSATLETITFDVSPDGTFSHGYGDQFADKYDTDFGDVESIDVPFSTSGAWVQDTLDLDDDEDENTVEGVAFRIDIYADTTSGPIHSTSSEFDVTVLRAEPEGEVVEGEGEAFGEG